MFSGFRKYRVLISVALFLVLTVPSCEAYMAQIPRVKTINGNCIHPMFGRKIPADESYYPKDVCERHTCDYARKTITIYGCGVVMTAPGCQAVTDPTKKYPNCCMPKIVCP
ncbi:uncharacterized protein LOC100903071 [Galendromus occidentalis]|uniref:Uncharacterized protein LOC100903071 n=1 Tax=Galendromus occidentalis TaxID=34638 RepID=A0AAJ6QR59_9ACAR|nr:uncharacterized protein LOC100903071 [Galendromus occidentalis]